MYYDEKGQKIQTIEKILRILLEEFWNYFSETSKKRIEDLTGLNFSDNKESESE